MFRKLNDEMSRLSNPAFGVAMVAVAVGIVLALELTDDRQGVEWPLLVLVLVPIVGALLGRSAGIRRRAGSGNES